MALVSLNTSDEVFWGDREAPILIFVDNEKKALDSRAEVPVIRALHKANLMRADVLLIPFFEKSPESFGAKWSPTRKTWTSNPDSFFSYVANRKRELGDFIREHKDQFKAIGFAGDRIGSLILNRRIECSSMRGYFFHAPEEFVIPDILCLEDPHSISWKNWQSEYYLANDFQKLRAYAFEDTRPLTLPNRFITNYSLALECVKNAKKADIVAIDIEVSNMETSHIGFSHRTRSGELVAFSIPFDSNLWSIEQEVCLRIEIAQLLGSSGIMKIFQNGIFDIQFLAQKDNILTAQPYADTMITHSLLFPDFKKGLGFLGSVYTNVRYWKDEGRFGKSIKKED